MKPESPIKSTSGEVTGRYGVVLMNMGGPASEDGVYNYLRNIFSDPAIMPLPGFLRPGLARLIALLRKSRIKRRYRRFNGRSPLLDRSSALEKDLGRVSGLPVVTAMRYSEPSIETALGRLHWKKLTHIIALPLYPQYSLATTYSAIKGLMEKKPGHIACTSIESHYQYAAFQDLHRRMLEDAVRRRDPELKTAILFVAHSIPLRNLKYADPYVEQVHATVDGITRRGIKLPFSVAFQSKVGPVKWQGPSIEEELQRLRSEDFEQIIVHPVSFALENLETLWDLDYHFKACCRQRGIRGFIRVPVPGEDPQYPEVLASIVHSEIKKLENEREKS